MLRKIISLFFISILFFSCENETNKFIIDDNKLPGIQVEVKRYGKSLFELDTINLAKELKLIEPEFPLFLNANLDDTANTNQIKAFVSDTALQRVYRKTIEVFPDNIYLNAQLTNFFKYLKYYYPEIEVPDVYTYISGLQYESPVYLQDSILIIGIDLYLNNDFTPYFGLGLPRYKIDCMRPDELIVDVAKEYYNQYFMKRSQQNTLLDRMLAAGKLMYYMDMMLPQTADSAKICYPKDQLNWVNENEKNIWAFLIDNDLLFSTDYKSQSKLMMDGPFTTGFSKRSPARIGVWVGWQIIGDYMDNNPDMKLEDMLKITDSQNFFTIPDINPDKYIYL